VVQIIKSGEGRYESAVRQIRLTGP
jgi:hypothetical protein